MTMPFPTFDQISAESGAAFGHLVIPLLFVFGTVLAFKLIDFALDILGIKQARSMSIAASRAAIRASNTPTRGAIARASAGGRTWGFKPASEKTKMGRIPAAESRGIADAGMEGLSGASDASKARVRAALADRSEPNR